MNSLNKKQKSKENNKKAILPGSFDPFTKGHLNLVKRASEIFDELVIGILINPSKTYFLSLKEREEIINHSISRMRKKRMIEKNKKMRVISSEGFLVDLMQKEDTRIIIKGIRNTDDFLYEKRMFNINKELFPELEEILLFSTKENEDVSSSFVKSFLKYEGWESKIEKFLPNSSFNVIFRKNKGFKEYERIFGKELYEKLLNIYGDLEREIFNLKFIYYLLNSLDSMEEKISAWFSKIHTQGRDSFIRNSKAAYKSLIWIDKELAKKVSSILIERKIEEQIIRASEKVKKEI